MKIRSAEPQQWGAALAGSPKTETRNPKAERVDDMEWWTRLPKGERALSPASHVFRWTGRDWEIFFRGGRLFHLPDVLGSRYLNYLLHAPNEPIEAFALEVAIQPEKGEARARNSIQAESDPQALSEYRQELGRLQAERQAAQAAGEKEEIKRLEGLIAALESAISGGGAADTGERARDNVRKALRVVMARLKKGGPEGRAFAAHLRTYLSVGHECLYRQREGRIWE
jgi:hypothetical protein